MCRINIILVVLAVTSSYSEMIDPLSDEFIDHINSLQSTWKAGRNFNKDTPLSKITGRLGALTSENILPKKAHATSRIMVPSSFDAREQWPNCSTIGHIRDQSSCGSCWAVVAAETMSDRTCIHSNGKISVSISGVDLLSCCKECGDCNGGYADKAWKYWIEKGIVSGGDYDSHEGCRTYPFSPCDAKENGFYPQCDSVIADTPKCYKECDAGSKLNYQTNLYYGKSAYFVTGEEQIKAEILENGPVEAIFMVYEDFASYKSGVYQHVAGKLVAGHGVKIIGWGEENGTPYWLVANSWNDHWGDKGFFKTLRGQNHCEIEKICLAGLPKL